MSGFVEKRRVVVQICSSVFPPLEAGDIDGGTDWLYALCDDGSMWTRPGTVTEDPWRRLPDVPQGDED